MSTYKVIQDVEAEDKLLGPLTLRQFVYAAVTMTCLWLGYFVISKGVGFLAILFVPPAIISGFFAFPWGREQPTELWALARIRFMFKPRKRIWNQSGIKDLVTITVPKKIEQVYTDGLSQHEVRSRLQALASTIDSRGWAIKGGYPYASQATDRLVQPSQSSSQPADEYVDIMDVSSSTVARQFDSMLTNNAQQHRQQLVQSMQQADQTATQNSSATQTQSPAPDFWFMNESAGNPRTLPTQIVSPGSATDPYVQPAVISKDEEAELVEQLKARDTTYGKEYSHLPTILPLAEQEKLARKQVAQAQIEEQARQKAQASPVTAPPDAAILELARNDDFNVETIARQAKKAKGESDEVVISLH